PHGPTDIGLTSVSGEIAIRLPDPADADVEANTASGAISNAFENLRVQGQWGAHKITGRLGAGTGKLRATTVSGSIALLRRPGTDEEGTPGDAAPPDRGDSGDAPDPGPSAGPTAGPTEKKVLCHAPRLRPRTPAPLPAEAARRGTAPRLRGDPPPRGALPGAVRALGGHRLPAPGQAGDGGPGHPHHRGR